MKKIRIPLTYLLAIIVVMFFFVERNVRNKFFPGRELPFGGKLELDKGWDKLLLKRARRLAEKKEEVEREEKPILQEPTAKITAFYTDTEPVLDGKLDETCWETAQDAYPFIEYEYNHLAYNQTHAYAAYSARNLYMGFICEEESIKDIKYKITSHDGAVWTDDCLEVFIDTEGEERNYFHFVLNSGAIKYEARHVADNGGTKQDVSWNPLWHVKTFIGDSFWSAEIRVPLRELGIKSLRDGMSWRINFNRERYAGEPEYSSWSCTYGGFHNPKRFGTITFQKKGSSVRFLPIRSKVGENRIVVKVNPPLTENFSCELKLLSAEGKLISTWEVDEFKDDTISIDYEVKEAKMYSLLFTLLNPHTDEIHYRTDSFPVQINLPVRLNP